MALRGCVLRGAMRSFVLVLATLMLPYPVTMVPLYVIFTGWAG